MAEDKRRSEALTLADSPEFASVPGFSKGLKAPRERRSVRSGKARWCKGCVGVEHQWAGSPGWNDARYQYILPRCTGCSKKQWSRIGEAMKALQRFVVAERRRDRGS